ncbi:glycosyltransferase [Halobacteriovorax sp. JY17]|uniref:glycosyltransferase n=1 Tax=Halobacteriovorax sp. JY17 TaxID=2014617 RepID=UPI000C3621C9|nr:glycosyltransferase [Halobacteriovorax sp. JY17]PIK14701.1 MAG: hypothetical protein CES88_10205 [Halobacteriovorax sp. JY17]
MKRRVVQIVRSPVGGIRKHILSIIEGLGDEFEMFLITDISDADKRYFEDIERKSNKCLKVFNLKILDQPGFRDLLNIYKILQIVKLISPNVLHGHGAKGGLYARVVGFLLGVKVIYTAHGGSIHDMHGKIKNRIYSIVERILYKFTDLLVFESKYTMKQYSSKIGRETTDEKFCLNYNAIDFKENVLELQCREINPEKLIVIGAFGLLRFIKGHDLLIMAVSSLIEKGYKIQLNIFGSGEEEKSLLDLAKSCGMSDFFKIFREADSVNVEMSKCHIVVHPSRFESFGYVPLEALVNGATVVSSLEGGLFEVMDEGRSGFCVKDLSENTLSKQIEMAILNKSEREKKFNHAITYLSEMFSTTIFFKRLGEIYNDCKK